MEKYDVIVLGGGMAGVSAAVTAAEMGARTILIERYGYLGGMATGAYVVALCGLWDGHKGKHQMVRGNFSKITDKAIKEGFAEWTKWNMHVKSGGREVTIDPEGFKWVLDRYVVASGVELHFHTFAMGYDDGISLVRKAGLAKVSGKLIIDCSGDADTAVWFDFDRIKEYGITMGVRIGGIDGKRYPPANTKEEYITLEYPEGKFPTYRWMSIKNINEGFNDAGHIEGICIEDPGDETRAELMGRSLAQKAIKDIRKQPGYENAYIISVGAHIGHRNTRQIFPQYHLSGADLVLEPYAGKTAFPDTIAIAGLVALDYGYMPIPYRAMLPKKRNDLIYAGRCVSTTVYRYNDRTVNGWSYELPRLVGPSMATGEAAGIAAALCADRGYGFNDIPVADIQKEIKKRGGVC